MPYDGPGTYLHWKGGRYEVLAVARLDLEQTVGLEAIVRNPPPLFVIYQARDDYDPSLSYEGAKVYIRTLDNFNDQIKRNSVKEDETPVHRFVRVD